MLGTSVAVEIPVAGPTAAPAGTTPFRRGHEHEEARPAGREAIAERLCEMLLNATNECGEESVSCGS